MKTLSFATILFAFLFICVSGVSADDALTKPNIVIVFADDLGYGDLACYGNKIIRTPRIDAMAAEGARFTDFYAQTVCGPSRSSLLTGCYPLRVARLKNQSIEIHPRVHSKEITIAEMLKAVGYRTGCFGKWDQAGHSQSRYEPSLLPCRQGFDTYFGTPSSNDGPRGMFMLRDQERIEGPGVDMNTITRRVTDAALEFIRESKDGPFFAYIPHPMPHTILGASEDFRGKSPRGLYGDVVEELDYNTGRIIDEIKKLGLTERTYVFFISDNGPWELRKEHGGSAAPLRGAKTSTWEGGLRVPSIAWAPGRIPAGRTIGQVAATLDMMPTLAKIAGGKVPDDRIIDGRDISSLLHADDPSQVELPERPFYYYQHTHLQAVRFGKWKLHVARPAQPSWCPRWAGHIKKEDVIDFPQPTLYDLENDIGETTDVAADNPEVLSELLELIEKGRTDIGDYNIIGSGARFFDPQPRRPDIK